MLSAAKKSAPAETIRLGFGWSDMSFSKPNLRPSELSIFLGRWRAEGTSYGGTDQSDDDPRANGVPWVSEHHAYWYTGEFFVVQDERARPGGETFDTLWVIGRDNESERLFARTFENHGFYRNYTLERDGLCWIINGKTERAKIVFSEDGRTQDITWEWKPEDRWLPLCDRTATRID